MEGSSTHVLDAKGRLFIPARLKEELGSTFYVTVYMKKCLAAFSKESWKAFSDKVKTMSYANQGRMSVLFASAAKCELDSQGRILLPQALRDYAGLSKNVTIIGSNDHAEIWDSDEWNSALSEQLKPEKILNLFEELEL